MMETAKVDVRKLQLLNDRINQTLDALNQLRVSVHGLQHTGAPSSVLGQSAYGVGQQTGYGVDPRITAAYGINPYTIGAVAGVSPFAGQQFGAQPFGVSPFAQAPWLSQLGGQQAPWMNQGIGVPGIGMQAMGAQGFGTQGTGGISHTGIESVVSDPYVAMRAAQAFPYLFSPVAPLPF